MEITLRNIVAKIAETTADFPANTNLRDDLNVDSVRALELIFEVERVFEIQIPEERYKEMRVFETLLGLVASLKQ